MGWIRASGVGVIKRQPELRYTDSGMALCTFNLEARRRFKKDNGEWGVSMCWLDVTIWGASGEDFSNEVHEGDQVLVEGNLKTDSWEDKKTGQKRSKVCMVASSWEKIVPEAVSREDVGY